MNARDLLAAATPRPWADVNNGGRYGAVVSLDDDAIAGHDPRDVDAYGGALVGESIRKEDRALIVAAVNGFEDAQLWREALEVICSRGVASHLTPYGSVRAIAAYAIGKTDDAFYRDGEKLFTEARAHLDAIRATELSQDKDQGHPHSQQERAGSPDNTGG